VTRLAIIVPTAGDRPDQLRACLTAIAEQVEVGDRVTVVCDHYEAYDQAEAVLAEMRARNETATWRFYPSANWPSGSVTPVQLGKYGHPSRNSALDAMAAMTDVPEWTLSIDDDDEYLPGAFGIVRTAIELGTAPWYVARMVGGGGSHFNGVTVPQMGDKIEPGNIGTPMMIFPTKAKARFGTGEHPDWIPRTPAGYFGDFDLAEALREELGEPAWIPACIAAVRPSRLPA